MKNYFVHFNYIDGIELSEEVANLCAHSGDCTEDVERCMELPEVKKELDQIQPEALVKELEEYGAWDEAELQDHNANLMRLLWLAAGNIVDGECVEVI